MKLDRVILHQLRMPLREVFETSFGRTLERDIILVEAVAGGVSGWGEVTCTEHPFYNEECTAVAWTILSAYAIPRVVGREFASAADVAALMAHIRGHRMARGGLEAAVWDLEARLDGVPLWRKIGGGARLEIPCGVSIGIQESVEKLEEKIERELADGYQRIKIKIKPGWDVDVVRRIRSRFPALKLMVDANSAYSLADTARLKQLDEFYLMMIEQPIEHDDIVDHARLQRSLATPICLDESIRSARHAGQAIELGACGMINIKLGRVGGFGEARRVHDAARAAGIPVWCGGMLESGVGRAHNVALSTLENFVLPGDVSASRRYWDRDIVSPPIEATPQGTIRVSGEPGFGYALDMDYIRAITVFQETVD